nr:helix-turn-helix domain-containing protein [Paraburkholderia solisilvae]
MVHSYWHMECSFDRLDPQRLKGTCWRMGELSFAAADVSAQQWTSLAGAGQNNWRNETIVAFMTQSGVIELEQCGVKTRLTNASLLLLDPSRKYVQTGDSNTRGMAIRIPKSALEARGLHFTGRDMFVPDATSPDVRMLKSLIASTAAHGERSSPASRKLVADHLIDLMQILADDPSAPKRVRSTAVALSSAKRYIERNLGDEALDLDSVARAAGVSTRYIAKLFAAEGSTVMRHVWRTRLERAQALLTNSAADLRISDVAWQCGFANPAHFSRAFKQQFGESPKHVQLTARDVVAQANSQAD